MSEMADMIAELWLEVDRDITESGWHAMSVFPTHDDPGPPFTYTVGLAEQGLPELIVFGLTALVGYDLIDTLVSRMRQEGERLPAGPVVGVAQGYVCWLVEAEPERAAEFARMAFARAEGRAEGVRVLQLVWPDRGGRLPWESGYADTLLQPLLGQPKGER